MSDSAEGSPSPNIHFRELDVEFLQKQARIWLEAVLGERFDEDTTLADLLADGEILQRVSSIIGELLQKHSDGESASPRSLFPEAASNGKHSGKYLPYSNIDAFLKVCQKVGLTGVDLFSPPDVVEEKDIRRVCLCIRAVSKKAQVRHLGVPNFDYVTHSVAMPTDLVGGLRESLTTHANSANKSPFGSVDNESKETLEKIRSNPLLHKRSDDNEDTIGPSSLSSPELLKKMEESRSLGLVKDADGGKMNGETVRTTKSTNGLPSSEGSNDMNDSKSPYKMEEDTAFFRGSIRKVNRALFKDHRDTKQGSNLEKKHSDSLESQKVISSVTSSNGENPCIILCTTDPLTDASKGHSKDMEHCNILKQSAGEELSDQGKQGKPRRRTWVPIISIAMAFFGAVFIIRAREPTVYEVRKGDTLSEISRRAGKSNWEELAHLNPGIQNPDLIYPSEKLRLRA